MRYDRDTSEIAHFNWRQYYHMNKGVDDVAAAVYKQILRPDRNSAYMALVRESGPLYCSEGDMAKRILCQRMIGYALFKDWLFPDGRMVDEELSAADRENYYFVGYFSHLDKPDVVVRKKLDGSLKLATELYEKQFTGKDAEFNIGVMGHTAQRKWWNARSQYNGKLRNHDVFRMLATYAQTKLQLYTKDVHTEQDAKMETQDDFDKRMGEQLEKLKAIYKGPGVPLFRQTTFSIVTFDKRTDLITRPWSQRSNSLKVSLSRMARWAFDNVLRKELPVGFMFLAQETGTPFYCSEGPFSERDCRRMIGQSISAGWLKSEHFFKPSIPAKSKDYFYYGLSAKFQEGEGIGDVAVTNFTSNLKDSMAAYGALFAPDKEGDVKYNVGILLHTSRQQILAKTSMLRGNAKYQDSLEVMVSYAQKAFKLFVEVPVTEKGVGRMTTDDAKAERQAIIRSLRGLYTGKFGPPLYKPYTFSAYVYDHDRNTIRHFHSRTASMKAGLMNIFSQLNTYMIKPLLDASYVILVDETMPLYCSKENDFKDETCRLLIGAAMYDKHLTLEHEEAEKRVINAEMSPKSADYTFLGYVQNAAGEVKRINLLPDQAGSIRMFKGMVGEGKDYLIGIIGHSARQVWLSPISQEKGAIANHDVFRMLSKWCQEKRGLFVAAPKEITEAAAGTVTKEKWQEHLTSEEAKLKKLYTGSGVGLYRNYLWNVVSYHR
jgi:hypothetical protein